MAHPTRRRSKGKATASADLKPYPEYPLSAHPTGRWCKKIRGKLHYFGPLADPKKALAKWERERDYLLTGRTPPANPDGTTVVDLCDAFLAFKEDRVTTGELSRGMWAEYRRATGGIVATFGKGRLASDLDASDFARLRSYFSKGRGLVATAALIRKAKICFKWAYDSGLIDRPPRYGQSFALPNRSAMRKERAKKGRRDFTADEVRAMVATAQEKGDDGSHLLAFILLGINCGLGVADIGAMPATAIDLAGGWLDYPRAKTGVGRRCRLWPETVNAIRAALAIRSEAKAPSSNELAFLTPQGYPYMRYQADGSRVDGIAGPFRALCKAVGIDNGLGFYSLRRTLATVADGARDPVALRYILGHAAPSSDMGDVYRQRIDDERLAAIADHVRKWLFPSKPKKK